MQTAVHNKLPPWARSAAATGYGYYLSLWRYGHDAERYVKESFERDQWDWDRTAAFQQGLLREVLQHAATSVPYYRNVWRDRRRNGDTSSWEVLENWNLLDKEEVRRNPRAFLADDCRH